MENGERRTGNHPFWGYRPDRPGARHPPEHSQSLVKVQLCGISRGRHLRSALKHRMERPLGNPSTSFNTTSPQSRIVTPATIQTVSSLVGTFNVQRSAVIQRSGDLISPNVLSPSPDPVWGYHEALARHSYRFSFPYASDRRANKHRRIVGDRDPLIPPCRIVLDRRSQRSGTISASGCRPP